MASPKTRANMARVAAAAIFAAGASLAVVGTASADGATKAPTNNTKDGAVAGLIAGGENEGVVVGLVEGSSGGDTEGTDEGADQGTTDGTDEGTTDGTDEGASDGTDEGTTDGTDEGASDGTDEGASDGTDEGASDGTDEGTSNGTNEGTSASGGVNEGTTGNDPEPATEGGSSGPIEQEPPTEGDVPVEEAPEENTGDGGELAETGASGNDALLIVGAATMIAGGVAFRYLPRLINKGATPA